MNDIFANLYEWFGLIPFFSKDMADHLKGFDITCSDFIGTPLYFWIGILMLAFIVVSYVLQYHVINSSRFNKRIHWWISALIIFAFNFFIAFLAPFWNLQDGNYCNQLNITVTDCIGFGLSNAVWSLILFVVITSLPYPRRIAGYNMTETTFWKPKS